jgi:hypothetical protein
MAIPLPPTNVQCDPGNKAVWLSWGASSGATLYKIYRSGKLIVTTTETSYIDTRVSNGTAYDYQIIAHNDSGDSDLSDVVRATPATKKGGVKVPPNDLVFPESTMEKWKGKYITIYKVPGTTFESIKVCKAGDSGAWKVINVSPIKKRQKIPPFDYVYTGGIVVVNPRGGHTMVIDPELHYNNINGLWEVTVGQNASNINPLDPGHHTYGNNPNARDIVIHPFDIGGGSALPKPKPKPRTKPKPPVVPITNAGKVSKNNIITMADVVKGRYGKFNPPPHNSSRPTSPLIFPSNLGGHDSNIDQTNSRIANAEKFNNRGFMYQDLDSAYGDKGAPKAKKNLWGFEFMYNPTDIKSTDQANTAIDYTNPDANVANQLTGSQSFTISILINRMTDMAALHKRTGAGTDQGYPRALTSAEVRGIKSRGTEYDLEFLYRVVNGEPTTTPSMDMPTSDFGFISGLPIWLRLNNEMNYKGVIAAMTVTHAVFTPSMVPMMSNVQITFNRIPVMGYGDNNAAIKSRYTTPDNQRRVPNYTGTPATTK